MTGTTIAQAIPLALTPILTRIYTPDDFGVFALYLSIVSIISTIATLKYELTIVLPKKDEDAANLTILSIIIAFFISILALLIIIIFHDSLIKIIGGNEKEMSFWLYFVPVSTFLIGVFNSLSYWAVRKVRFKMYAISKVVLSSGTTITQICLGLLKFIPKGLMFGEIVGRFFATITLSKLIYKKDKKILNTINKSDIKKQIKRYKNFPIYSIPADLINVITNQAPVFIIGKYFGADTLGSYSLMERVLAAPIAMLGRAVLDVFKQKAGEDYNTYGNCRNIYKKTFISLFLLSLFPAILLFFLAPLLFKFIFGPEWALAGEFAQIMSVLFIFKFTASPLSYVFYIVEKQKYDMIWQIFLFIVTISSFSIGIYQNNIKLSLIYFSISYSIMYIIYLLMSYKFSKGNKTNSNDNNN